MDTTYGVRITAAAGTYLAPHLFARRFKPGKSKQSLHSKSPYHAFAHCKVFATAAPRRARTLISVSFSGLPLSRPVWIKGLVGIYPANNLIHRGLTLERKFAWCNSFSAIEHSSINCLYGITPSFPGLTHLKVRLSTCY